MLFRSGLVLLIPLVYLVLAVAPPLCCLRAFGRGQSDVSARSVLVAVPIGLVPAVEVAYFANDAAIIASLTIGSAIAAFVCTLLRKKLKYAISHEENADLFRER